MHHHHLPMILSNTELKAMHFNPLGVFPKLSTAKKLIALHEVKGLYDLTKANHILSETYTAGDFNAFKIPIENQSDLKAAAQAAYEGQTNPDAPWYIHRGVDGKEHVLSRAQCVWLQSYGLPYECIE